MRFIGNKTQLLENIKEIIDRHAENAVSFCDIFSGTASVARYFKQWYEVYSNDLLYFSYCLQRGTVQMPGKPDFRQLASETGISSPTAYFNHMRTEEMESLPNEKRFFQNHYAPAGGRMYVTDENALRIDFARNQVENWHQQNWIQDDEYYYLIACIVEGIPYVSNISGTYGAYNKKWDIRSHKEFALAELPVFDNGRRNRSYNRDGISLLRDISGDILYIDPPYNERQYPPNYHVLETAAKYDFPVLHGVTGMREYENQRSDFCSKRKAVGALDSLMANAKFRHIILSYNTDGIMPLDKIEATLKKYGIPETYEVNYIPYRRFKSGTVSTKSENLRELLIYIRKEQAS